VGALVSAELVGGILFTPTTGDNADMTYSGNITIQRTGEQVASGSLQVVFPSLGAFGKTIGVSAAIAADAAASGIVTADEDVLANISTAEDGALVFTWLGNCAP